MDGGLPTDAGAIADGLKALTAWSAALDWTDVPDAARAKAATVLADDLAATIAARDEPELKALVDGLARSSGPAEATVFDASGRRLDRYSAATANGSAGDWCELDGGYRRAVCHAGIYCVPALLAEGEAAGATVEDMLRALLIGFETAARVARTFEYRDLVLHPHGSVAAVGAAATVAALRRHPADLAAAAISSAATMVLPAPFNHTVEGALVRNVWPGVAASTGLRAVDWAEAGITGRPESLHDVYARCFGGAARPAALTDSLGEAFAVSDAYHKLHACCQYTHAAVEATLEALAELPERPAPGAVKRMHIDTHWRGRLLDKVTPATTLAAKFSLQHVLATTAVHGHAGAEAFHAATLDDPWVESLRGKVTIGAFEPEPEWPNDRPSRVTIELMDGTTVERTCLSARGGPDRPFSDAEIHAKVHGIVDGPYPALAEILDRLLDLDDSLLVRPWREVLAGAAG